MGNVHVQEPPKVEIKKPYAFHGERVSDHNWNQFIHIYAVVTTILFLKYFFSTLYGVNPEHHPKEDSDVMEQSTPTDVKRRERQFMNDVESIPFHVSMFILAFVIQNFSNAAGHGRIGTLTLCYVYPVYMFSRVMYTICYIFALQPFRTLFYFLGTACVFIAVAIMLYTAFEFDVKYVRYDGSRQE